MSESPSIAEFGGVLVTRLLLAGAALVFAGVAQAQSTLTLTHAALPSPTLLDLGAPGQSVGDVRLWHFKAKADDGTDVRVDWIMTTTAVNAPEKGIESRFSTGTFSFGAGTDDQLILEGIALYAGEDATLKSFTSTTRVVVGGSGRFAGAKGSVETIHLEDGTWKHVFQLE